jgi:exoribonuclease R
MAGRASVLLHTLIFFAGDGAKEEEAYVLDVDTAEASTPSFTVIVPRYGIEGRVRLSLDASDPNLTRVPHEHKLIYDSPSGSKVTIQVFDKVKVRIWVRETQDHRRELIVDIVEPLFDKHEGSEESPKKKAKLEKE